ncbi:MAG: [Fe-S]-binding protein [Planctomycetales bacterium]
MPLPRMFRIRQTFDAPRLDDVAGEVERQLAALRLGERVRPGDSVAVTAGSRGIANIAAITRAIVEHLKRVGAAPFIVPAMGSHGGGTVEGQLQVLASYGITTEAMGAPIRASMETVVVDRILGDVPVHFDRHAFEANHVLVAGRVKPHTLFVGEIESGLHKMMLIGLGKHEGAKVYHRAISDHSFGEILGAVAEVVLRKCKVVAGLAIVENAYDETALVAGVRPEEFRAREAELLARARGWMPRLPFPDVDLLIVDRIGKNISGSGMDTNVVGRKFNDHVAMEGDWANCRRIYVCGLTPETHGNALGIGMAEYTNERTIGQIDRHKTWVNCVTSGHPTAGSLPIAFPNDREGIAAALTTVGLVPAGSARVIQIADTLHLKEVLVSEAYRPRLEERDDLEIVRGPSAMEFDAEDHLRPVCATGGA